MDRAVNRDYFSDEIVVHWDSDSCIHCGNCVSGLPQVFNLKAHPWIDVHGASTDEIIAQVEQCPSGALTWSRR